MKFIIPILHLGAWVQVNLFTEEVWRVRCHLGALTLYNHFLRLKLFYHRHLKP